MFCSFRMFIDRYPVAAIATHLVSLFDFFSDELNLSFDYISHLVFCLDSDSMLIEDYYSFTPLGKIDFSNLELPCLDKIASSPYIEAYSQRNRDELFSNSRIQIEFSSNMQIMIIRIDYEIKRSTDMSFEKFKCIIDNLCSRGFHVNNSFFHVYTRKKEVFVLDGGQHGAYIGNKGRRILRKCIAHKKRNCRDHLMDIFAANSIPERLLSNNTKEMITRIVGLNKTAVVGDSFVFALSDLEKITGFYQMQFKTEILRLNSLFD